MTIYWINRWTSHSPCLLVKLFSTFNLSFDFKVVIIYRSEIVNNDNVFLHWFFVLKYQNNKAAEVKPCVVNQCQIMMWPGHRLGTFLHKLKTVAVIFVLANVLFLILTLDVAIIDIPNSLLFEIFPKYFSPNVLNSILKMSILIDWSSCNIKITRQLIASCIKPVLNYNICRDSSWIVFHKKKSFNLFW